MKRLKHYLLLAALSFTAMCCGTEDGNASEGNNTDNGGETVTGETTLALTRTGTQGVIIRDPNNDFTEEIEVTRTGTDATASFRISVWTEGELTAYNEERGTAYYLLPSNAYTLTETGSVAQGQTSATVPVTLRVDELKALVGDAENAGRQYVLPLRLTSENATVQSIRSEVMLLVSLNIPYFRLLDAGTSRTVFLEEEETAVRVGSRLMTGSSLVGTETGFGYTLAAPSNAETLVEEYNRIHGTGYELLPESAYTSQETQYGEGESTSTAVVTIHREQTGDGIYMLPLSVDLEEGANVQNGGDVCYILTGKHSYTNPIIRQSVPDPTVLRDTDGYYYLYGTEDLGWIPVFRSIDMVDWERMPKDCFQTQDSRPYWGDDDATSSRSLWAPEIRYINGQYVLYYSWAIWGNEWNSDVGVAVSDSPTGPFVQYTNIPGTEGYDPNARTIGLGDPFLSAEDVYPWLMTHQSEYWQDLVNGNEHQMAYAQETGGQLGEDEIDSMTLIDVHPFVDPNTGKKYLYAAAYAASTSYIIGVELSGGWTSDPKWETMTRLTRVGYYTANDLSDSNRSTDLSASLGKKQSNGYSIMPKPNSPRQPGCRSSTWGNRI